MHLTLLALPLLAAPLTPGPRSATPTVLDMPVEAFSARLGDQTRRRGLPLQMRRAAEDRVDITVVVPVPHVVRWHPAGERLAVADSATVQIVVPGSEAAPRTIALAGEREAPPRLFWTAAGALVVDLGQGEISKLMPDAPTWSPMAQIRGTLEDLHPSGDRILVARSVKPAGEKRVDLFARSADGWQLEGHIPVGSRGIARFHGQQVAVAHPNGFALYPIETDDDHLWRTAIRGEGWPQRARGRWPHGLWIVDGRIHVATERLHLHTPFEGGPTATVPRTVVGRTIEGIAGGETWRALTVDAERGACWRAADGAVDCFDPQASAAAVDPSGERVALMRAGGLFVRDADGREVLTGASIRTREMKWAALTTDDGLWLTGVEPESHRRLSVLGPAPSIRERSLEHGDFELTGFTRLGWRADADADVSGGEFAFELLARFTPYVFAVGGDDPKPGRRHLFMPSVQYGTDVVEHPEIVDDHVVQPRLTLPLMYRTERSAVIDGRRYTVGHPLTIALEPGVLLMNGSPELGLTINSHQWGGVYGRVGFDREADLAYYEAGLEFGRNPTVVAAGLVLIGGLVALVLAAISDSN